MKKLPALPSELRRRQRGFSASNKEYLRYKAAAEQRGLSLSEFIRALLEREIAQVYWVYGTEGENVKFHEV